jgi:hypothetical protein
MREREEAREEGAAEGEDGLICSACPYVDVTQVHRETFAARLELALRKRNDRLPR